MQSDLQARQTSKVELRFGDGRVILAQSGTYDDLSRHARDHLLRKEPSGDELSIIVEAPPGVVLVSSFPFALCDWDCGGLTTAVILTQIRRRALAQEPDHNH